MKKISKTSLLTLSLFGLVGGTFVSNKETVSPIANNGFVNEQNDSVSYTLKLTEDDAKYAYLDGLPGSAKKDDNISFRVSLKPGFHFNDKLTITTDGGATVDSTVTDSYYSFKMPADNVTIDLDLEATDFTIKTTEDASYFIKGVYLDNNEEELTEALYAKAGTKLKFQAEATEDFAFTAIKLNGKALEKGEDGYYHFSMPARPAVLSSDKNAVAYTFSVKNELKLSTAKFYSDPEGTKPIEKAVKGDRVYIKLTLNEGVKKASYGSVPAVKTPEGKTICAGIAVSGYDYTWSFQMISADAVVIFDKEVDCTPYMDCPYVGTWKSAYSSYVYTSPKTEKYSSISSYNQFLFNDDGTAKILTTSSANAKSWTYNGTDKTVTWTYSNDKNYKGVMTSGGHLAAFQYCDSNTNPSWKNKPAFAIKDSTYDLHYIGFGTTGSSSSTSLNTVKGFLAWLQNTDGNIIETIYVNTVNDAVKVDVTVKKFDNTAAAGSDITASSSYIICDSDGNELVAVSSANVVEKNNITINSSDNVKCVAKDAAGNEITSAYTGATVYLHETLRDGVSSSISLKKPSVTYSTSSTATVTEEEQTGVYSFTMPGYAVTVTPQTKDSSKYLNYQVIGKYVAYNLDNNGDIDLSTSTVRRFDIDIDSSGEVTRTMYSNGSAKSSTINYTIQSLENVQEGTLTMAQDGSTTKTTVHYGDNLLATPWSSSYSDMIIGLKMPEGKTYADVRSEVHQGMYDGVSATSITKTIWATSLYVSNELFGSIFCYKGEVYTGVTFEYDEGSTRISSTSSYHVYKNEERLFDVTYDATSKKSVVTQVKSEYSVASYEEFAAAYKAAPDGATITLSKDMDFEKALYLNLDKKITIDLAGHTVSNEKDIWNDDTKDWALFKITKGEVTINDSVGTGKLKAKENDCFAISVGSSTEKDAKVTINGGGVYR